MGGLGGDESLLNQFRIKKESILNPKRINSEGRASEEWTCRVFMAGTRGMALLSTTCTLPQARRSYLGVKMGPKRGQKWGSYGTNVRKSHGAHVKYSLATELVNLEKWIVCFKIVIR